MTSNHLEAGDSRVGYAWDEKIQEPYPAMLENRNEQIDLVVPFQEDDDAHFRRYAGRSIMWGDDPQMERFDYQLPQQFWFMDAKGFVSLIGLRPRPPSIGGPSIYSECRLRVDFAVFGGEPGVDYSRINGLTTRIEGLGQWYGHRSVTHNLYDRNRPSDAFELTVHKQRIQRIDHGLNLSIIAGADWQLPSEPGLSHLEEIGAVRTATQRRHSWTQHLDRHRAIHALLELSAWQPLAFQRVQAMHHRDPDQVPSGTVVGDRWAPVQTDSLPHDGLGSRPEFMFTFEDIGGAGVRRWLRLRHRFSRGIHAMTFSIRHSGTSLDGLISDAGIGLEQIGHTTASERGHEGRRGHHAHLKDIAAEVDDLLPFRRGKLGDRGDLHLQRRQACRPSRSER